MSKEIEQRRRFCFQMNIEPTPKPRNAIARWLMLVAGELDGEGGVAGETARRGAMK